MNDQLVIFINTTVELIIYQHYILPRYSLVWRYLFLLRPNHKVNFYVSIRMGHSVKPLINLQTVLAHVEYTTYLIVWFKTRIIIAVPSRFKSGEAFTHTAGILMDKQDGSNLKNDWLVLTLAIQFVRNICQSSLNMISSLLTSNTTFKVHALNYDCIISPRWS